MSGFLNIAHNMSGETDFVIVEWVKSTATGTPVIGHVNGTGLGAQDDTDVTEVFYPAAHSQQQLQITELPEVWFLVRFWRSSDGTAKDLLLLTLAGNARTGAVYPITRLEYVVDRGRDQDTPGFETEGTWSDPVQNDTGLRDTRLADQTYWIEERGTGSLIAAEYTDRSDAGGGFDFTEMGKVMNSGAVYVVYVVTRVDEGGEDSGVVSTGDLDVFILDTDQDYDPLTMNGRTLIADFATTVGTLTIPNLASLSDSWFRLQTHNGSQRNVKILLDAGDTVRFRGTDVNQIILGQGEEIMILIRDNAMYVLHHTTNHERLGQIVFSYLLLANTLPADGVSRLLSDYPRVEELLDALPATSVVSDITWNTSSTAADGQTIYANKGKWMRDGLNFRPPLLEEKVIKGVSQATITGRYEHQEIMTHDHDLRGSFGYGGYDGGGNTFFRIRNLTDGFDTTSDVVSDAGGVNNIVNNIGLYPLVCI